MSGFVFIIRRGRARLGQSGTPRGLSAAWPSSSSFELSGCGANGEETKI
jgi:hypothetical protein